VVESLTGRPVQLDPGKHHFRFVLPGGETLANDVLSARRREKSRRRRAGQRRRLRARHAGARVGTFGDSSSSAARTAGHGALFAGRFLDRIGRRVASLASFGVFAVLGHNSQTALEKCSPDCDSSRRNDYDKMRAIT